MFTCGLNDGFQLGLGSKQVPVLSPTIIKALKNRTVVAIGTGRYHTAVATATEVLSFGKNLGQLGHDNSAEAQVHPRVVRKSLYLSFSLSLPLQIQP